MNEALEHEALETEFEPSEIVLGRPVCGGRRTGHEHEGETCLALAGWGTVHKGSGPCKHHGGEAETGIDRALHASKSSYISLIKHKRLREIYTYEETREQIDSVDEEIILMRSLIKLLSEQFGLGIKDGEDEDEDEDEGEELFDFNSVHDQASKLTGLIDKLSTAIKRKYEVLEIAGAVIPRDAVRAYVNQVQLELNRILRNTCRHCGAEDGQRDKALEALAKVGSL